LRRFMSILPTARLPLTKKMKSNVNRKRLRDKLS
jgi:hypothetical protein